MAKHTAPAPTRYMVIDVTTPEATKLLKVCDLRHAALWGYIFKDQGLKVIAPPIEGRGFAKLEKLNLQYFYWNLCGGTPPDDYQELVASCLAKFATIGSDASTTEQLMAEIAHRGINLEDPTTPVPKEEKDPHAPPVRPKALSTTGLVWELADVEFVKAGNQLPDRAKVIAACEAEGINPSTAATQYAKWKKEKASK